MEAVFMFASRLLLSRVHAIGYFIMDVGAL